MDSSAIVTIEILRSQLLEIHHSLQQTLLSQIVRKNPARYKQDETRKVLVRMSVTCLDSGTQEVHVEELSRLLTIAESLKTSFDVLSRANSSSIFSQQDEEE